jgi:serine/threonine-protein kinase RsbW
VNVPPDPAAPDLDQAPVTLTVPASSAYVVLIRTAATALAARADFPLDRLDDLRLAVDEAAALLIADAAPGAVLTCLLQGYAGDRHDLTVRLSTVSTSRRTPDRTGFAWAVLTALVDEVDARVDLSGVVEISLRTGSMP